ncbi:MAG: DNA recombination protein RmuC [Phascolarctobacterium sp.]|nr:DNA recombination protein RmuC [Phascolarctobacterium sp.]
MPLEQILLLVILVIVIVLAILVVLLWSKIKRLEQHSSQDALRRELEQQLLLLKQDLGITIQELGNSNVQTIAQLSQLLKDNQKMAMEAQRQQLEQMEKSLRTKQENMLFIVKEQLEEIRGTVDEKLQTTLERRISESFKTVSQQLEQVYKGLGEMQSLASDVGGLKKIMSGVKTRGNLGEYQLAGILAELLAPEQYDTNVATIPKSSERVEFAVKLPHEDGTVYLPIDSKFPAETYAQLRDAQESGDRKAVEAAYKNLENVIKSEAKDIRTKYVAVPYTTNFAIMFLPAESLYAEVVSRGMVEALQRDYQVNVAGPSTMAAILNSLQMGFKTLALQKQSSYAWQVLGAVKTEFEKFGEGLKKMQTHLDLTSKDLDALITTRSNQMQRKLREVERLDERRAAQLLELADNKEVYKQG